MPLKSSGRFEKLRIAALLTICSPSSHTKEFGKEFAYTKKPTPTRIHKGKSFDLCKIIPMRLLYQICKPKPRQMAGQWSLPLRSFHKKECAGFKSELQGPSLA